MSPRRSERARKAAHVRRKAGNQARAAEYRDEIDDNTILSTTYDRLSPYLGDIGAQSVTQLSDYFLPGFGAAATGEDALDILREADSFGDYALGAGLGGLAALELVPVAGALAKPVSRVARGGLKGAPEHVLRFAGDEYGGLFPNRAPFDMGSGAAGLPRVEPNIGLRDVYDAKAAQMKLKPADRIQPRADRTRIIDENYQDPAPMAIFDEDLAASYPRNPDPGAALPLGDRARALVDNREQLARGIADKIRQSGQMEAATRYFYHSDGPIYRAAVEAGLSPDEATDFLRDFSGYFAATSPRTDVQQNLLNTSSVMAKDAAGIPHRELVGPGSGGISERGYPMMTGSGGIHGQLIDQVQSGAGIDRATNTKPATFGANMAGNRSGVTVDTHAVRGTLMTMNEQAPGSVPDGFILPKYKAQYAADPTTLTPNMIDDSLGKQMIGPKGDRVKAQTEYPVFADIWHGAADELGVSPAEAQSMGWFGMGADTNLASAHKTVADVMDERIDVTAQVLGLSPQDVARRYFRREIPLMGIGGAGLGLPMLMSPEDMEARYGAGGG